ncbi:hypothetical protein ACQKNC_11315 [Lysinibacillus sp. NPDC094177]|uniref:hypothetical protein n=1 Tax=Lysinibacillus sp. NPDC094177 TaxID=3390580 RepID=UPI003D08DA9E
MKLATYIKQHNEGKRDFAKSVIRLSENIQYNKSYEIVEVDDYIDGDVAYKYHKIVREPIVNSSIEYIAVRVRSIKEVYARYAYTLHLSKLNEDKTLYEETRLTEVVHSNLMAIGQAFDVYEFDKVEMDMFPRYGEELDYCLGVIKSVLPKIKAERTRLFTEADNAITRVLNDILPLVDLAKSDKEIVTFINKALSTRTPRELNKVNGTRFINRKGKSYYVSKDKMKLRPKQFIARKVLEIDFLNLSEHQKEFAKRLLLEVQADFDNGLTDNFIFDEDGFISGINKRHYSERMELKESNFKNTLGRIQAKYQDYKD